MDVVAIMEALAEQDRTEESYPSGIQLKSMGRKAIRMALTFMDSYTLWRSLPFPSGGSAQGLKMTYADLAEADEYVTTVIRFVERGIFKPAPVDLLAMLEELMQRIDRLGDAASDGDQVVARQQHAYAALLGLVYRKFLETGGPHE
ncbi:hypothetical protein BIV25_05890 [Streptomyces sp. MUSC 14]|uniref:hypothetical protein n=1 Tax=Streptomyces sp. MUSC 14 TaxID=1354889 RepID=UPI0008F5B190|nr:hypothetical protein [Streptomyces sp. MUSC 14]OIK01341.1 hypothetical protein BIV25_05890 [Streptomyces sp. MUSC 14]